MIKLHMRNIKNKFCFIPVLFFVLFSCTTGPQPGIGFPSITPGAGERPKLPSRQVQQNCKGKPIRSSRNSTSGYEGYTGPVCGDTDECAEICDDIFSNSKQEKECYEYPPDNVYKIQDLLAEAEEGVLGDEFALKCLMDISYKQIESAFKMLNQNEAQDVLIEIAADDGLAEIFADEDSDFKVLEKLLEKATRDTSFPNNIKKPVDGNKGFMHLASEGGEEVWNWLEGYVGDKKPNEQTILSYCWAILGTDKMIEGSGVNTDMSPPLIESLVNGDNFRDTYQSEIEAAAVDDAKACDYSDAIHIKRYCDNFLAQGDIDCSQN